ncbi:MAG: hypothetical protein AAF702_34140 [Chloroflexota bacterium]
MYQSPKSAYSLPESSSKPGNHIELCRSRFENRSFPQPLQERVNSGFQTELRISSRVERKNSWLRFTVIGLMFVFFCFLSWMTAENGQADSRLARPQQTIPPNSSIFSDDFNRCDLSPKAWEFINPKSDSSVRLLGQQIEIDVPGGVSHDAWDEGNLTPRLMQNAEDTNFEIEAKFDALFDGHIQLQGFIIEEDEENFLRINIQSSGSGIQLLVVRVIDGVPDLPIREDISAEAPLYLQVLRWQNIDLWRISYSYDGETWNSGPKFELTQPLSVTKVGVFAGNAGNNPPAFKARIDYFFNLAQPIEPEDPLANQLDVVVVGDGGVERNRTCGSPVQLTATESPGWTFGGWHSQNMGILTDNPLEVQAGDVVTATFLAKPFTIDVDIEGSGTVTLDPDTPFYSPGEQVKLMAEASVGWAFDGWDGDLMGQEPFETIEVTKDHLIKAKFRSETVGDAGFESDNFNTCAFNTSVWGYENPQNDALLLSNGEQLHLSIPGDTNHDVWTGGIQAPYIWQPVEDNDLGIELKYDSVVSSRYQLQGMLIIQDDANLLRINVQHDNTAPRLLIIRIQDGTPKVLANELIASGGPVYLQLIRTNDFWSVQYRFEETSWLSSPDMFFTHAMAVNKVGAFVGNASIGSASAPAFSGQLDYFYNLGRANDTDDPTANHLPVTITGNGQVQMEPSCGNPTIVTAIPDDGWLFKGWGGVTTGEETSKEIAFDHGDELTALFEPSVVVSNIQSDIFNRCAVNGDRWQIIDPLGDATVRIPDAQQLAIEVPGGRKHDIWLTGIEAPHVMQQVNNANFETEVKFGTTVSDPIQLQGLLIQADAKNFIRLNVQSTHSGPEFLVITFVDLVATILYQDAIDPDQLRFRILREGDSWQISSSNDGASWNDVTTFEHTLNVSKVGLFAGNASNNPPPFTATFDYFINRQAEPVTDESSGGLALELAWTGAGTVEPTPNKVLYNCDESVTLNAIPDAGWSFASWGKGATGQANPLTIRMDKNKSIDGIFEQDAYILVTNLVGGGNIDIDPLEQGYLYGQEVQLTAIESDEWTFVRWSGDLTGTELKPSSVEMTANREITATFKKENYTLSLESVGDGQAVASKSDSLVFDEEVTLTATPKEGWEFVGWTRGTSLSDGGQLISVELELSIRVTNDDTYYANFVQESTDSPAPDANPDPDTNPDPDGNPDPDNNSDPANTGEVYLPFFVE